MLSVLPNAAQTALGLKKLPMMLWRVLMGGLASVMVDVRRSESSESVAFSLSVGRRNGV